MIFSACVLTTNEQIGLLEQITWVIVKIQEGERRKYSAFYAATE